MKIKRFVDYLPFILMAVLATFLSVVLSSKGEPFIKSVLVGSSISVFAIWLLFFVGYRFVIFLVRGAPFKVGHIVRITTGDYAGDEGEVVKLADAYPAVFVSLLGSSDPSGEQYFDWNQVTRRGVSQTGRTNRGRSTRYSAESSR